jgi:hypothetical protein
MGADTLRSDIGKYDLIQSGSRDGLVNTVNSLIKDGWVPIGGPVQGQNEEGRAVIIQAMVLSMYAKNKQL